MVLISIQPFSLRKASLFIAALLCFLSASCFADSVFLSVPSTPYDRQMTRIKPVLQTATAASTEQPVSLSLVNRWIGDLRCIPYGFSMEWKTPAEVESGAPADCKGKAVALYERMHAHGANNIRLVIGKRTATSRVTHAWISWETGDGTYVLDPTINWTAFRAEEVGNRNYIPYYAYAGNQKYRAASVTLYARN